jgi:hypothetical protein
MTIYQNLKGDLGYLIRGLLGLFSAPTLAPGPLWDASTAVPAIIFLPDAAPRGREAST